MFIIFNGICFECLFQTSFGCDQKIICYSFFAGLPGPLLCHLTKGFFGLCQLRRQGSGSKGHQAHPGHNATAEALANNSWSGGGRCFFFAFSVQGGPGRSAHRPRCSHGSHLSHNQLTLQNSDSARAFGTGKNLFCTTLKDDVLHDISHLRVFHGFPGFEAQRQQLQHRPNRASCGCLWICVSTACLQALDKISCSHWMN